MRDICNAVSNFLFAAGVFAAVFAGLLFGASCVLLIASYDFYDFRNAFPVEKSQTERVAKPGEAKP
jgi:hypothetical protein